MFVIMMGFTFFSASMWAGGKLGNGLTLKHLKMAIIAGNLILGAYTGLLAWIASRTRLSVHLLSHYVFGDRGSYIPSGVLAFTQIGWFGVGVAMFAIPAALALMDVPALQGTWLLQGTAMHIGFDNVNIPSHLLLTLVIGAGVVMTSSAYWGIKALNIVSIVAVPAIAIFGCYSMIRALFFDHPATLGTAANGFAYLSHYVPTSEMTMATAITIAIGSFISGGTCTPDFTRYAKSPKIGVGTTVLAFFIGNSLMFLFGAVGAMVWGKNDISLVLQMQGLLVPAVFVLLLNIWTTNDNALYTSGLGLSNITGIPKRYVVIFNGLLGTVTALWLYDNFTGWLNILNTFIPPVGAVLIVDYALVNHGHYPKLEDAKFRSVNISAVVAWAVGSFVALVGNGSIPGLHSDLLSSGLPAITGMLVSVAIYLLMKYTVDESRAGVA